MGFSAGVRERCGGRRGRCFLDQKLLGCDLQALDELLRHGLLLETGPIRCCSMGSIIYLFISM